MIKPAALIMAVTMGAVSAGTYFGLDLLPPGLLPEPIGRAQKPEPPKPGVNAFAGQQAAAAAPAQPAPAAAPAEQPVTEQDLAEEPPPPEPAAEPAVAQAAPEPTPEPETVAAAPPPKPEPYKPGPALADTPTPAKAAPRKRPPESDVIKPWWPDASQMPANQLKLQYAGQVQGEQAVALLFSAPLNLEALRQHAQIKTDTGQPVKGDWQLGKNPRLAVFRGLDSGRYTVILSPQVADAKGFMLGQTLQGPVYIQPPAQ